MDFPTEPGQTLDIQPSRAVVDSLSNSVIVGIVLEHFSNRELLQLSLVNKLWSYEARSVMRNRGNSYASLKFDLSHPWQQVLQAFGTDLQKMNIIPYSGIIIRIINLSDRSVQFEAPDLIPEAVLDRLALKRLSVELYGKWKYEDFPPSLLVKKLLQHFSKALEELELDIGYNGEEFIVNFVGDNNFPSLKVLKLKEMDDHVSRESYTNYLNTLVPRAKNLQELHSNRPINLMSDVLEGSEIVLVHESPVRAPFDNIPESLIDTLRLGQMLMRYHIPMISPEFSYERFNRFTPKLLQASCTTTLYYMDIDEVLAVPLMCYGIPLRNVEDPVIGINYNNIDQVKPEILRLLKNFDFTRIFPNANRVSITCPTQQFEYPSDHLNAIVEQAHAVLGEPMPDRAANIKKLYLKNSDLSDVAVSFFAGMFPTIERLEILTDQADEIQFGSIWKCWVDLKKLEVRRRITQDTGNLDSVFCGVFPEEIAELRLKDDDYLKTVNIVPVMPAVTCMKNLKTLNLRYSSGAPYADEGLFMFSKVTGLVAFARCPSLAINITLHCPSPRSPAEFRSEFRSHLKAFASVSEVYFREQL